MIRGKSQHGLGRERGRPHQRVEAWKSTFARQVPAEVERRAGRRGDRDARDTGELAVMQRLVANTQVCWWAGAGPDKFDGFFGVDPLGAVQGGCRRTRDDGTSARPQPGGDGAIPQREFSVPGGRRRRAAGAETG
jgi:hypothetical protein